MWNKQCYRVLVNCNRFDFTSPSSTATVGVEDLLTFAPETACFGEWQSKHYFFSSNFTTSLKLNWISFGSSTYSCRNGSKFQFTDWQKMFTNKPWARSFANPSPGTACSSRPDHVQEAFPFKLVWFLKPEFFHLSFVLNAWWIWLTPGTLFTFSSASIKGCTRSRESKWYFLQTCRQHKFSILRTIKLNFLPFDDFSIEESGLIRLLKWWPLCKLGTQFRSCVDSLH